MAVFDVPDMPYSMIHGRKKYQKWNYNSLDEKMKNAIRRYSYKNKGTKIALRTKDGLITPFKEAY